MRFLLNLVFSAVGSAYIIYGRRHFSTPFLVAGFVLLIYPYFVSNLILCVVIGAGFVAWPYVAERIG